MMPTKQPEAKIPRLTTSNDLIAPMIKPYMPMSNKIKLPEIPGNIMAHMAIEPAKNRLIDVTSISFACDKLITAATIVPNISHAARAKFQLSTRLMPYCRAPRQKPYLWN